MNRLFSPLFDVLLWDEREVIVLDRLSFERTEEVLVEEDSSLDDSDIECCRLECFLFGVIAQLPSLLSFLFDLVLSR